MGTCKEAHDYLRDQRRRENDRQMKENIFRNPLDPPVDDYILRANARLQADYRKAVAAREQQEREAREREEILARAKQQERQKRAFFDDIRASATDMEPSDVQDDRPALPRPPDVARDSG